VDLVNRLRLSIAEKPTVARAIAADRGAILCGEQLDVVEKLLKQATRSVNGGDPWCCTGYPVCRNPDAKGKPDTTPMRGKTYELARHFPSDER